MTQTALKRGCRALRRTIGLIAWLVAGAAITASTAASDAKTEWTRAEIAALFPAPMGGWTVSALDLRELETVTSGFESFALAPLAEAATVGVSVRLKATRRYSFGEKTISITFDTEDIETAAMVDAVDAVASAEDGGPEELVALGEELLAAGVTALSHGGYPGFSGEADGEAARAFKIGSAGAVTLECAYPGCTSDLDALIARLDFAAIAAFVAFDHRR